MMLKLRWVYALSCCATLGASMAAQALPESNPAVPASLEQAVAACRTLVADQIRRLACYDAMAVSAASGAPPSSAVASRPGEQRTLPLANPSAPESAFGLPAATAPSQVANRVTAHLKGRFDEWSTGTRFVLDNGQVWQVVDGQGAGYALDRPRITIQRGLLGSFFATVEGVSAAIKVKRLH